MEIVSLSQDPGEARVAVVTTAGCPHCKRAKKALGDSGIAFREVNLEGSLEVLGKIKKLTGRTTVPQVRWFISAAASAVSQQPALPHRF